MTKTPPLAKTRKRSDIYRENEVERRTTHRGRIICNNIFLNLQDAVVLIELVLKKNYQIPKSFPLHVPIDNILYGSYFIRIERSKSNEYYSVGDTIPLIKNNAF